MVYVEMVMSKLEIKSLFQLPSGRHLPCGLNIVQQLWWRFVPGVVINVQWPVGEIRIRQEASSIWDYVRSADPNDHYRPWMEKHVGRQGWDWDWGMANNDVSENRLTIKIRQKHAEYATIAQMRWS